MQNNPTVYNIIRNNIAHNSTLSVVGEWNLNRYANIIDIGNIDADEMSVGYDPAIFPIQTIFQPNRPDRHGVIKAHNRFALLSTSNQNPQPTRTYVASAEASYKYYVSPYESTNFWTGQGWRIQGCCPYVKYSQGLPGNILAVTFENSFVGPIEFDIFIHNGTNWELAGSNAPIDSFGTARLYLNSSNVWSTSNILSNTTRNIYGIAVRVNSMTTIGATCDIIEIAPTLRIDLSDKSIGFDFSMSVSENDFISPLGTSSSNSGTITFSNIDKFFSNESNTLLHNLIDRNAKFSVFTAIDGIQVQIATGYSDTWSGTLAAETQVSISDSSRYLQEAKCPQLLMQDKTSIELAWRILDMVGFTRYQVSTIGTEVLTIIPFFWSDGESTIWEVLQDLARGTQMAVYFDEFDVLHIRSRNSIYNGLATPNWLISETNYNGVSPDLIGVTDSYQYEANKVTVRYRPTNLLIDTSTGLPATESIWKPEDTVALRSTPLKVNMDGNTMAIYIDRDQAITWPFSGMVNIEGELIKYDAKNYGWYDKSHQLNYNWVRTADEQKNIDNNLSDPNLRGQNFFAGALRVSERGVYGSVPQDHHIDIDKWTGRHGPYNGVYSTSNNSRYLKQAASKSAMRVLTPPSFDGNTFYQISRGEALDQGFWWAGTRLRFDSTATYAHGVAGIAINKSGDKTGYFVELILTELIDKDNNRRFANEVRMYRRAGDGVLHPFASAKYQDIYSLSRADGKGSAHQINKGVWYDLDISFDSNNTLTVFVDGVAVLSGNDPLGALPRTGEIALFTRGNTVVEFDYAYAIASAEYPVPDQTGFLDRLKGGFSSQQGLHEVVYSTRKMKKKWSNKKTTTYVQKYNERLLDEFGPMVHEVREFTVKFEKSPVTYAGLYLSNDYQIVMPEFNANPFQATFTLANASRSTAIAQGEDTLTYGTDNPVQHQMFVYGRTIVQQDEKEHEFEIESVDANAVRSRGTIPLQFESTWIQSEAAAKELSRWILTNWAKPSDVISLDIFGNPLLQIGDIVQLYIPSKNLDILSHSYVVTEISRGWDSGLNTAIVVRKLA